MDQRSLCEKFLANPKINPKTGKYLQKDKGPYTKYVKLCRDLGYNKEVDNLFKISNRSVIPSGLTGLPDIDREIILRSDVATILNLLHTNKETRKFVIKLLLTDLHFKEPDLVNLVYGFLGSNEIALAKTFIDGSQDFIESHNFDLYTDLGERVLGYNRAKEEVEPIPITPADQKIIEYYFELAPEKYDWKKFLEKFKFVNKIYIFQDFEKYLSYLNNIIFAGIHTMNKPVVEKASNKLQSTIRGWINNA
jgi:hypothetical protein